ncbi:hypothetical protein M409DRAFT_57285 [Zasmidium cellare ATCC 36951]|uniref:MARVEL domain-containing protein n=1 Tax=Zasmidium cellare ATCC 36951 TaxID=1080233 RepID=A0A6A6CEF0_ZASCE|nr:uncharacterized protein M409DRAFT_57285 [Zasmidium cellare ATCC 36951]KAF2163806.1 hypothetical protein M409DRAFT_57285 [Zasmidium cellare ATCC 36951]
MALQDMLNPRYKLPIHIVQIILVIIAIGLSVPRLFMKGQPRTRANTIALGMGAKSLIIIGYQLLTEHVAYFHKWASLKANAILNALENVFWGAVVFLVIQANISRCVGVGCTLSWVVVGVSIVLTILAAHTAAVSFVEFRRSRQNQRLEPITSRDTDTVELKYSQRAKYPQESV